MPNGDTAPKGLFNGAKSGVLDTLKSILGGMFSGAGMVYLLFSLNEQAIEVETKRSQRVDNDQAVELRRLNNAVDELKQDLKLTIDHVNALRKLDILPDAEKRITKLEQGNTDKLRRIQALEDFKTEGKRCTARDCGRMENRLTRLEEKKTSCIVELRTLAYRMQILEGRIPKVLEGMQ